MEPGWRPEPPPSRAAGEIDLERLVVAPADVGPDGAVLVEGHQGGLGTGGVGEHLRHRRLRRRLGVEVERGHDPQASPVERLFADGRHDLLAHPLDVVRRDAGRRRRRSGLVGRHDRGGRRGVRLGLGDLLVGDHVGEDGGTTGERLVHVLDGVGRLRRAEQPDEQRGLVEGQVDGVRVEVQAGGRFDAVRTPAEVHGVEVALEDLVLVLAALELHGQHRLARPCARTTARW